MQQQTEVLPSELHLVAPPTIPQARSYLFKQQSDLQEYDVSKGTRIRINIPRLQRSYLMKDSYIRFFVNIDFTLTEDTQKLYFDRCGAFGLFDRIEVYDYLGGTLLEQTQNVPALATLLHDLNSNFMDYNGKLQATQGFDGSNVQTSSSDYDQFEIRTANSGMPFYRNGVIGNYFTTMEFTLPVMSFLGLFSDKYIPLHNGFSVDFYLNDKNLAFVSRSGTIDSVINGKPVSLDEVWISNFEYCCQVMELGEQAESMVMASNPFVIPSRQYRYFSDMIIGHGTQSNFRLDMNLNVVSLRNIRFGMRPSAYQNISYPSYGHRIRNFLENFTFQYGSSYLPEIAGIKCRSLTVPISRRNYDSVNVQDKEWLKANGNNQAYVELLKTISWETMSSINKTEFRIDTAASGFTNDFQADLTGPNAKIPITNGEQCICGKFAAGLDTRLSRKETVSGIDTNGLLVSINGSFDRDKVTSMVQSILDVWAEHDSFIQIIPGVATTVTF